MHDFSQYYSTRQKIIGTKLNKSLDVESRPCFIPTWLRQRRDFITMTQNTSMEEYLVIPKIASKLESERTMDEIIKLNDYFNTVPMLSGTTQKLLWQFAKRIKTQILKTNEKSQLRGVLNIVYDGNIQISRFSVAKKNHVLREIDSPIDSHTNSIILYLDQDAYDRSLKAVLKQAEIDFLPQLNLNPFFHQFPHDVQEQIFNKSDLKFYLKGEGINPQNLEVLSDCLSIIYSGSLLMMGVKIIQNDYRWPKECRKDCRSWEKRSVVRLFQQPSTLDESFIFGGPLLPEIKQTLKAEQNLAIIVLDNRHFFEIFKTQRLQDKFKNYDQVPRVVGNLEERLTIDQERRAKSKHLEKSMEAIFQHQNQYNEKKEMRMRAFLRSSQRTTKNYPTI